VDPFEALADPVRRSLLSLLVEGATRVVDLAAAQPVSRPAVSKHLRLLGEAGLVEVQERGRERHYRITPQGLDEVRAYLDLVAPASRPPVRAADLDALETEVRRTVRERRRDPKERTA
jgi:DNA-binding transcriptional ArsR family regulator